MPRSRVPAVRGAAVIVMVALAAGVASVPAVARGDVTALGAYDFHACALRANGGVWCWGLNGDHQLGDGTTDDRSNPVRVETATGLLRGIRDLSPSGYDHACAITENARVRCWGLNDEGQLGDGSADPRLYPVTVMRQGGGALTRVRSLGLGRDHSCALRTDGTVWCWGDNVHGQLGDGTTDVSHRAVQVRRGSRFLTKVRSIGAGIDHTCAVRSDSSLWCWGQNDAGQLGIGTSDPDPHPTPRKVRTAAGRDLTGVRSVDGGNEHTCALLTDGTVRCWGRDESGEVGNGSDGDTFFPMKVKRASGFLAHVTSVDVGYFHSCARTVSAEAYCWGFAGDGELGIGPVPAGEEVHEAVRVRRSASSILRGVRRIRVGDSFTCLLKTNGTVWCMGYGSKGQIGDGATNENTYFPVKALVP